MKRWMAGLLGLSAIGSSGCAQQLINTAMVYSPHKIAPWARLPDPGPFCEHILGIDRQHRIAVGPPEAELRVWIVDPEGEPRGTIFCLHGYRNNAGFLLGTGHRLAQAGYRVVLVDLRGHGGSTGDTISYGVIESRDLVQVLDELDRRGEIVGPVGAWGISMGASTAILFAGIEPRIETLVAVVPYATLRGEIFGLTRRGLFVLGWMMNPAQIQAHVDAAAAEAGFDPDEVDAGAAMRNTAAKALIFGARWDWVVPYEDSVHLARIGGDRAEHRTLEWTGHLGALFDPGGGIAGESVRWFDRHLKSPTR